MQNYNSTYLATNGVCTNCGDFCSCSNTSTNFFLNKIIPKTSTIGNFVNGALSNLTSVFAVPGATGLATANVVNAGASAVHNVGSGTGQMLTKESFHNAMPAIASAVTAGVTGNASALTSGGGGGLSSLFGGNTQNRHNESYKAPMQNNNNTMLLVAGGAAVLLLLLMKKKK